MTNSQLRAAIAAIQAPDGDGYRVQVTLRGGHTLTGAHHAPDYSLGIMRIDGWTDEMPGFVVIPDITSIRRVG